MNFLCLHHFLLSQILFTKHIKIIIFYSYRPFLIWFWMSLCIELSYLMYLWDFWRTRIIESPYPQNPAWDHLEHIFASSEPKRHNFLLIEF